MAVLCRHCAKMRNLLYTCQAEDTVGKNQDQPSMEEMTIIAGLDAEDDLQRLHMQVEITIDMKAMVIMNIAMEADLANGTWGIINDIVLDHREHLGKKEIESGDINLMYPSAMIVFQPVEASFPRFDSFKDGKIPLFPLEYMFRIAHPLDPKKFPVTDSIISWAGINLHFSKVRDRQFHTLL